MILRRVTLERYGCFGSAEFEFRRGTNLVSGANETGKSLLLAALPAALIGVEHGPRLRSWGDSLNCRVALLFEGPDCKIRLTRDLESSLVRIEERDGEAWQECFAGRVPPGGAAPDAATYYGHLERLFGVRGEALLRALLDAAHADAVFGDDGLLVAGLLAAGAGDPAPPVDADGDQELRRREIAALEAALAADREEYRKGVEYLAWIRRRWESEGKRLPAAGKAAGGKATGGKTPSRQEASLERKRDELLARLREQGLPARLPVDLPAMFETAEGLRQELSALQLELTPLQRRKPTIVMPQVVWPLLATACGLAAAGLAFWQKLPWWLPLTAGCGVVLLLIWGVYLVRLSRARAERDALEQELQAVELKRAEALARQNELAERFEACGLPSAPVEMVKLQQLCRRHQELIEQYHAICAQLGDGVAAPAAAEQEQKTDRHLQPEELPEAEARLAELGESLRRRESRLAALLDGAAVTPDGAAALPARLLWTESQLLQATGQHLERLTGRRYQLRMEEGQLRLEVAAGRWAAPAACSRGTAEALVLAVRLACAQLTGGTLPLPVDDLPAHLDAKRRQAALRALERFGVDHQLLLASSDEELARRAVRERWHVINLQVKPTGQPAAAEEADDAGQLHLL